MNSVVEAQARRIKELEKEMRKIQADAISAEMLYPLAWRVFNSIKLKDGVYIYKGTGKLLEEFHNVLVACDEDRTLGQETSVESE